MRLKKIILILLFSSITTNFIFAQNIKILFNILGVGLIVVGWNKYRNVENFYGYRTQKYSNDSLRYESHNCLMFGDEKWCDKCKRKYGSHLFIKHQITLESLASISSGLLTLSINNYKEIKEIFSSFKKKLKMY